MKIINEIEINAPPTAVWKAVADFDNATNVLSAIKELKVLARPESGLIGLKWQETREMFGKDATETMWITRAETGRFYEAQAQSHGSHYTTLVEVLPDADLTTVRISFTAEPQSLMARIMSFLMAPLIKSSVRKAFIADLHDIKNYLEK